MRGKKPPFAPTRFSYLRSLFSDLSLRFFTPSAGTESHRLPARRTLFPPAALPPFPFPLQCFPPPPTLSTAPSPPVPLPAGRRSEPRPHFSFPEARPTCAAPPPYPVCPLPHLLSSARTRPAVPTKTKIRRWTCALLTSAPLRAGASPPPVAPC